MCVFSSKIYFIWFGVFEDYIEIKYQNVHMEIMT